MVGTQNCSEGSQQPATVSFKLKIHIFQSQKYRYRVPQKHIHYFRMSQSALTALTLPDNAVWFGKLLPSFLFYPSLALPFQYLTISSDRHILWHWT
jgi:hypothetical protein